MEEGEPRVRGGEREDEEVLFSAFFSFVRLPASSPEDERLQLLLFSGCSFLEDPGRALEQGELLFVVVVVAAA